MEPIRFQHRARIEKVDFVKMSVSLARGAYFETFGPPTSIQKSVNKFSKNRDEDIRRWAAKNSLEWIEYQQNGVVRNLKTRDGWSTLWHKYMQKNIREVPQKIYCISEASDPLPSFQYLQLILFLQQNLNLFS